MDQPMFYLNRNESNPDARTYWKQGSDPAVLSILFMGAKPMDIYKATNNITGESYIGYAVKGLKKRKSDHKTSAKNGNGCYFHNAIRKYGWDNFNWILLEKGITDFEILQELEIYWIEQFDTFHNGYNLTKGGGGSLGFHHTKETRRKMSEDRKNPPEEIRRKISESTRGEKNGHYGKHHTEEAKRKMSDAHKNCSEETRRKISEALKGKKLSEEHKRKISEAGKGRKPTTGMTCKKHSEETKRKMSDSAKRQWKRKQKGVINYG